MLINRTLRPNPFQTYRDPQTGRWVTVLPYSPASHQRHDHPAQKQPQPPLRVIQKASGS